VFKYVHFRHFGVPKNAFSDQRNAPQKIVCRKDVECICVGIRKIYEAHLSPKIIIDKNLIWRIFKCI